MKDAPRATSRYLLLLLAFTAASLLGASAWPVYQSASAQNPATNGKIAFVSSRNGPSGEIYVMDPDGKNQKNITNSPASETRPAFSPDGKKIAFVRDFKGIFVMNPDGSGQTQILDGPSMGFSSGSITGNPSWSADGKKIAFEGIPKGSLDGPDIYVINVDGTGLTRLTTDPASDGAPCWSPDGTKIAFSSIRDRVPGEVNYEIYVMNADGSNQTRITNNTKFDSSPAWSPDGKRIAFTSRRDDNFEVYVMDADGSNQTRLTNDPEQDSDAKWSPDGTKIAFLSSRDKRFGEIWSMNPDGTGLVNLTNADGFDMDPSWQNVGGPFVPPTPTPTPTPTPVPDPSGIVWQPFTPSETQTDFQVLTCGDRAFAKVKIVFSDSGYRISDFGRVQTINNTFLVDVKPEQMTGGGALMVITPFEKVYDLGQLRPGNYTFTLAARGVVLNSKPFNMGGAGSANPVDDPSVFVSQHYADFLGRDPDNQGFGFWTRNMALSCGTDAACLERKRIDTSAAFFLSVEFQRTGFLVYRLYRASYGRMPRRQEFLPDARTAAYGIVVNSPGWETALDNNTRAFVDDWVGRPDFKFGFDQLTDAQFVDRLIANAGMTLAPGARDALVANLVAGRETRAVALRTIVDDESFNRKEFAPAFVLMQYFGYLQRNPDEGQDRDMSGFNFWLNKLNQFGGDYVQAEMVKAFITSGEYRSRFCGQ
jgi:Tol biopolymer transport system component